METGADAEIMNLLELPSTAPDLWQLLTQPVSNSAAHASKLGKLSADRISADARVPVLSG